MAQYPDGKQSTLRDPALTTDVSIPNIVCEEGFISCILMTTLEDRSGAIVPCDSSMDSLRLESPYHLRRNNPRVSRVI